ncbi:formate hydrogenase [Leptospira biflexa]|jgi:formate hydrogenlyase subunit 4|uniref:respiratory chain complex I subunit 1 family protein n=1 Tax=Leptospira biflexa TaxID=172 RepID=UPI0010832A80|nr:NADH-quinone oxidoreductase subunit H [Leptospira biflexa]TGM31126.1 formate hydrogenase [Leptospira biflexa]TGM34537.1 formate hydrogenase [Leptospira biflexa]TGM43992.1 formate hydrogenase [Leptospira biflexa]TGM44969.1 formate hydrogenase [Leptospira biflexa]TGM57549.1 formate hydrogenase [Leptospira biflexa]
MEMIIYFAYLVILFFCLPFLLTGIVRKVRAFAQGRRGPKLIQFFWEINKSWLKDPVLHNNFSSISNLAPRLAFFSSLMIWSIILFEWAPFILIPFFLAMYRFSYIGFAMEGATSFGGMASGREILLSVMVEPTFILMILAAQSHIEISETPQGLLIGFLFLILSFIAILAELAKPPFDDPRTHLELTMVHEAMILEASGRHLALFELSSSIKFSALLTFLVKLALEHSKIFKSGMITGVNPEFLIFPMVIFLAIVMGFWEANSVRRKWTWIPEFMGLTFISILILGTLVKLS